MKKLFIILLLTVFFQYWINAQQVFSSGASYTATSSGSLSWTIGETFTETFFDGNGIFTQGFHQTDMLQITCHELSLMQGYNMISTYIIPELPSVELVFQPIEANILILKDGAGNVYWPYFSINLIGSMTLGAGYKLNMQSADTLSICGSAAIPETSALSLPVGWSLIGYLRQSPVSVSTAISSILSDIIILKDRNGAVFYPLLGVDMIGNMMPGQGYQIKLLSPQTLTYPANTFVLKTQQANF
ncbi:MAG: hypothetical protein K9H64_02930 [Bacteroidales bacterium]|nr:hypothetical protein [Bacteroidales bacterium]MCF8454504.1 hypothetical protein [Bacteroidales bacterium]